jgi:hypothetical protein
MPAYLKQAPTGVPGDVTRTDESNVEPAMLVAVGSSPPVYPSAFGIAMIYVAGGIQQWGTGNVQGDFAGVLIREVPSISGSNSDSLTANTPWSLQAAGLLVRGYCSVVCQYGTPARGGIVYVNIQAATGRVVGGFEATYQSGYNIALTTQQATWATDGMDANNNAELRVER